MSHNVIIIWNLLLCFIQSLNFYILIALLRLVYNDYRQDQCLISMLPHFGSLGFRVPAGPIPFVQDYNQYISIERH